MFGEIGLLEMAVKGWREEDGANGGGDNKARRVAVQDGPVSEHDFFLKW